MAAVSWMTMSSEDMSCQVIDPMVHAQTAGNDWTHVGHLQATFDPAASDDSIIPLENLNYMDAFHLGPDPGKHAGTMTGHNPTPC